MWIQIKTYYSEKKEDIYKTLEHIQIKQINKTFEITFKDVNKSVKKQTMNGLDIVLWSALANPLQQSNDSSITLNRMQSKNCNICFTNVKNENEEHFSNFVDSLCEKDVIIIIDGVMLYQNNVNSNTNRLTIAIRPENNSSVFLFKHTNLTLEISNIDIKNLSKITEPGVYSLFGCIKQIIKYSDRAFLLLRIHCGDKSRIKTHKYPLSMSKFKNISKEESKSGMKYEVNSEEVDILVKHPCNHFLSLIPNQRIHINNIKVECFNNSNNIFSFTVKGEETNLKADPKETVSVKSLRPLGKHFPIPNELKPAVWPKTKRTSPIKESPRSVKQRKYLNSSDLFSLSDSSSSSNSSDLLSSSINNLSPHKVNSVVQKHVSNKNNNANKNITNLFCGTTKLNNKNIQDVDNLSSKKKTNLSSHANQNKVSNSSTPKKEQMCSEQPVLIELSSNDSLSPTFFQNTSEAIETTQSNQPTSQLNKLHVNSTKTQCLGPCRLLHTDPNVFCTDEIVFGYCIKTCFSFFPKSVLKKIPTMKKYACPICSNIIELTFFFKMNFLYGKNDSCAIEVCCYNENAQQIIKIFTKKNITVADYLSNHENKKLVIDTIQMFITNKTRMNIVVCDSPNDGAKILLTVNMKYIVS